jgi:hypothetical protein
MTDAMVSLLGRVKQGPAHYQSLYSLLVRYYLLAFGPSTISLLGGFEGLQVLRARAERPGEPGARHAQGVEGSHTRSSPSLISPSIAYQSITYESIMTG